MRRKQYQITDNHALCKILDKSKVCHIAMIDNNIPYILPMNFGYTLKDETLTLFFHCAKEGRKIDILKENHNVSFTMVGDTALFSGEKPCQYGYHYSSVMGTGKATFLESPKEKEEALQVLMKHQTGKDFVFSEKETASVCVIKIDSSSFEGKQNF